MTFPTTGVLSSFTGTDENPLSEGGNWTATDVVGGTNRLKRVSNQCSGAAAGGGSQVWNTSFAAAQEVYVTIAANPAGVNLYARLANINTSSLNGYIFQYDGSSNVYIYRCTAATTFQLATAVVAFSSGDVIGFGLSGNVLTGYKNGTSVVSYDVTSDGTKYTGAGYIGLFAANNTILLDTFGGGATSTAPVNTVAPAVTGTKAAGKTLTTTNGTWTGDVSSGYAYQWRHCDAADGTGNIANATNSSTSSTYVVATAEKLKYLFCNVTATGTGGSTLQRSNVVGPIGTSVGSLAGKLAIEGDIVVELPAGRHLAPSLASGIAPSIFPSR